MELKDRIKQKREQQRYSKAELARIIGVSSSAVGQYENGSTTPKSEVLIQLSRVLKYDFVQDKEIDAELTEHSGVNTAPYYENVNASAGLSFLTDNHGSNPTSYIKVPGLIVDAYINVFGDSMYPKYESGQVIGVKRIEKDLVHFGHAYIIEMADGEAYIKYIQPGADNEHWSLENENSHYRAREFHLSKIRSVYKIKSVLRRESL